ncbi:DUF4127 family protein [Streptomyces omiyaensis]|uniref:DUF4127 family protein n=1 Tax=Streptomyces omiyaensis TaxID=68247 RepID=A0ABW7BRF0_9ACTN|nr:DUF4127 family protein [Streptomyces omiyaensis]GGY60006.1 hypothetical protein GCM10010363_46880 [Streptomyces omiyaensis]
MSAAPARQPLCVALLPLDERPACSRLPAQIAAVAGAEVLLPPAALMPRLREPGDADALGDWLVRAAPKADAAVVSLETLGHGGLIASRTQPRTVAEVTARWQVLAEIAATGTPVHAVTLITRTPDSDDAMEEPEYWDPHGPALHRLSAALHRGERPTASHPGELAAAREAVPGTVRSDFARRRLRNHALNLTALELAAAGVLDSLVVGADDTAPWALATAELQQLRHWRTRLEAEDRVAVRPGADEATATLVARTLLDLLGGGPVTVRIEAIDPHGLARVAPYENVPVGHTAAGQIEACGATVHDGPDPDLHLLVHTPDGDGDWAAGPLNARHAAAETTARALAGRAAALLRAGHSVAVADCAQPNGSDPLLVDALLATGLAHRLTSYAGWNTAGNTLGTAVAHAVTAVAARRTGRFDARAHLDLLAHRLIEDRGYMTRVRADLRTELGSVPGRHDHVSDADPVLDRLVTGLTRYAEELPGFHARITPGSVHLPWRRTFEADFDVTTGLAAPATGTPAATAPSTTTAEETR